MSYKYFQGNNVHDLVKASHAGSFREVVDALRICPVLGMTRAAFLALPKKERNNVKQVPFFVPAVFRASPSKRVYDQATHCNLLFLDLDELPDGKCPAAPFVSQPESLYKALAGYNFAAHTTASSTRAKPRMRIIVDASNIPLASYVNAVGTVAAMLGLPNVNKESRVAVQPMFLPTQFSDSNDEDHPLIAHRLDGRAFTTDDISTDLAPEYHEPRQHVDIGIDALNFLRAPVPEITLSIAKEALSHIDPDCSYYDWLECAAALKHQFSPKLAEEAYALFDEWSEGGQKYGSSDDTRAKWDSLRPTPIGRMPITIRTLLKQAVQSGWDDKKVKDSCFNVLIRWMEEVGSITDLMERGAQKIMATPLLSAVQEDVLVNELCKQAKKRFAYSITATAIRKDIVRMKQEIKAQEKPAEKIREPVWAKGVCYISQTNEFFRHRTGEKYTAEAFNAAYSRWLLPTEEALKDAGLPVTPATLSRPIVLPKEYALNHLKIAAVYDYAYDPSQPTDVFFVNRGRKYVNTYSPTYPEPDYARAEWAGKLFLAHRDNLILEPEYRRVITDFIAYMVQFPGRKIRWAVFIQSAEGAGKTFFAKAMQAVLGFEHVKVLSDGSIKSGYNEWASGSQFVAVEEIYVSGANRHAIMNIIKPLISNDDLDVNEKFRNCRKADNITNYMLFSNHHDALAITPNDRRYHVIKSPLQHKSQVLALGEDYFQPLYSMLRDNPGALRAWLLQWEISPSFRPDGHAPRTKYVAEMVQDSATDLTAAVRRLLLEGDYPLVQYDIVSSKVLMDVLQLDERVTRVSNQLISHTLREEGFTQIGRHMFGTDRHYLWVRRGADEKNAVATAAHRVKNNMKNLGMEILFE